MKFSHKIVKAVLDGSLTTFRTGKSDYEVGELYAIQRLETDELVGKIRILDKKYIGTAKIGDMFEYSFVLEWTPQEEETLRKRLKALGYI